MTAHMNTRIRTVLAEHGRLPVSPDSLADGDDLYQAGMTSHASISVMLGLENEFDVEFPDHMLTREVFASVGSIAAALTELTA
jgi:acyl carrier protein